MTSTICLYRSYTLEVGLKVPASYPIEVPPKKPKNAKEVASSLATIVAIGRVEPCPDDRYRNVVAGQCKEFW
ncbi:unnamed protein product [Dovyalis caffra]|uniref:Uncharacterized protein n=1 Tax=Dovyalis caffra TaxID=77055 RepID=A0AAV1R9G8_9ROSI|nr:unnamed protein product [Dovyalis caffra]